MFEVKAEINHHLLHRFNTQHSGKMGLQWVDRAFSADNMRSLGGGEDFIPAADQRSLGVFFYDQFPLAIGLFELGCRYEWQEILQRQLTAGLLPYNTQFMHEPISYQSYTFSSALSVDVSDQQRLVFGLNSAQRVPEIQELLSLGPHLATRSYDIGLLLFDSQLNDSPPEAEKFQGIDLRWEWQGAFGDMSSAIFYTEADDFIYQKKRAINGLFDTSDNVFRNACVRLEECIAVFDYQQHDVTLTGYEWQWTLPPIDVRGGEFQIELFADHVRGRLTGSEDLPRMPPARRGLGFQWGNGLFYSELRYNFVGPSSGNKIDASHIKNNTFIISSSYIAISWFIFR